MTEFPEIGRNDGIFTVIRFSLLKGLEPGRGSGQVMSLTDFSMMLVFPFPLSPAMICSLMAHRLVRLCRSMIGKPNEVVSRLSALILVKARLPSVRFLLIAVILTTKTVAERSPLDMIRKYQMHCAQIILIMLLPHLVKL